MGPAGVRAFILLNVTVFCTGVKGGDISATLADGTDIQLGGDIITAVDGKPVNSSDDLANTIEGKKPGDKVSLTLRRGHANKQVDVTLGKRPASLDQTQPGG